MNEDNKNSYPRPSFGAVFASISIWVAIVLLVVVFLHHCSRPQFFNLSLVSMADRDLTKEVAEHKGVVNWSQLQDARWLSALHRSPITSAILAV